MLEIINQVFSIQLKSNKENLSLFNRNVDRINHEFVALFGRVFRLLWICFREWGLNNEKFPSKFDSTTNCSLLNDLTFESTQHDNLHEGRIYYRAVYQTVFVDSHKQFIRNKEKAEKSCPYIKFDRG